MLAMVIAIRSGAAGAAQYFKPGGQAWTPVANRQLTKVRYSKHNWAYPTPASPKIESLDGPLCTDIRTTLHLASPELRVASGSASCSAKCWKEPHNPVERSPRLRLRLACSFVGRSALWHFLDGRR